MKVLSRFISGLFFRNYLVSASSLTLLFFFQAMLGQVLNHEYSIQQIFIYNILSVPQYFVQMTPPAVLMATVLTLSGLSRTNELIACYSIGVGLRQVMTIILSVVFMISCLTLVLQDRILPPLYKKQTSFYWKEMKGKADFYLDLKQDKIWYRSKNIIYNLKNFDLNTNSIHGISMYQFDDDFNLVEVVEANRAEYTQSGWKILDGTITIFSGKDEFPITKKFLTKELVITEKPKDFQEIDKEVDGLRLKELYYYIRRIGATGSDTKKYEVNFHSKISLSFIPLIMCCLAIPFSTKLRREGGVGKDLAVCLMLTFFYWLFFSVGLSLGSNGALPPFLAAWSPSVIFGFFAGFLIYQKWKVKS